MRFILSNRLIASIANEIEEYPTKRSGGVILGHRIGDMFYGIEAVNAGHRSIHHENRFVYDAQYVTYTANKVAELYKIPLDLIGYWESHVDSDAEFDSHEDMTNWRFAAAAGGMALTCLASAGDKPVLHTFTVDTSLNYTRIEWSGNSDEIPSDLLELKYTSDALEEGLDKNTA